MILFPTAKLCKIISDLSLKIELIIKFNAQAHAVFSNNSFIVDYSSLQINDSYKLAEI